MISQRPYTELTNNSSPVSIEEIPVLEYDNFCDQVEILLRTEANHCTAYFGINSTDILKFYCCISNDSTGNIMVFAHELKDNKMPLKSLTKACSQIYCFENEIHENFGVRFTGHPWLKPVRYPFDRHDKTRVMENYPFYEIESEELHEVGVGPIHAGVIEPGHFRFICDGEKVLHLEIQLGYQHRGVEKLFVDMDDALKWCILSESIAGDTSVGHELAHVQLIESLAGTAVTEAVQIERCIALELERLAVHIGDTAALCGDVAYQLGQAACEALRTIVINTTQFWCGNRFGKGLVRPGGTNYPLDETRAGEIEKVISETGKRFDAICKRIYSLPSVLARFDEIGQVTRGQASAVGAVGMVARSCGILRDIRATHPFQFYKTLHYQPVILESGDVLARGRLRHVEALSSMGIIKELVGLRRKINEIPERPCYSLGLKQKSFAVSVVEGWRGEICHIATTDDKGKISHYKIKDPSFHNWMALALAVRNQEISDFPVCNKSFNLSYCGHDL